MLVAEQLDHEVLRLRSLHLQRGHVGFLDRDVEVGVGVLQPASEQERVARGQREPERVLVHPGEHRVVDDAAVAVADQHVLRLTHGALRQIARGHQLGEREAVGAGDLEAPLHRDVPEGHGVEERVELVLERVEADREVHVVVDRVALRPVLLGGLVVGGAAVACTPLHQGHVERFGHRGSPS